MNQAFRTGVEDRGPIHLAAALVPGPDWLIGAVAGTFIAAFFFNWLFDLEPRRSFIAAGIYLAIRTILGMLLSLMMAA